MSEGETSAISKVKQIPVELSELSRLSREIENRDLIRAGIRDKMQEKCIHLVDAFERSNKYGLKREEEEDSIELISRHVNEIIRLIKLWDNNK